MLSPAEICSAIHALPLLQKSTSAVKGVSTDSRNIGKGELFVALKGAHFDGHDFALGALERGACGAVVEKGFRPDATGNFLRVEDTLKALVDLAAYYRNKLKCKVIGITGSNGKTTTKDMVAHILSARHKVVRAKSSFNNLIGLPLTILTADDKTEFLILEMGTNSPGEILKLGEIARPDIAVITNVSEAHLLGLGSIEGIAKEKASLLLCLRPDGTAFLNADNPWTAKMASEHKGKVFSFGINSGDIRAENIVNRHGKITFDMDRVSGIAIDIFGGWNVYNAVAALAVAKECGEPTTLAAKRLVTFTPPYMRMEKVEKAGMTFVNDAYNSNPVSAKAALCEFFDLEWQGRKVVVFGDMLELGAESRRLHEEVGDVILRSTQGGLVVTIGKESATIAHRLQSARREVLHFDDLATFTRRMGEVLRKGDLILLKASRGMGFENILQIAGKM